MYHYTFRSDATEEKEAVDTEKDHMDVGSSDSDSNSTAAEMEASER
jgi:hypothetical protein